MALPNGSVHQQITNTYTIRKLRTIGCKWVKHDGVWWKYWRQDYGGFIAEVPSYFESVHAFYTGEPFDV